MAETVLRESGEPMRATEIKKAIDQRYKKDINFGSLNSALAKFVDQDDVIQRVSTGRYAINKAAPERVFGADQTSRSHVRICMFMRACGYHRRLSRMPARSRTAVGAR